MLPLQKSAIFGIVVSMISIGLFLLLLFYKNFQVAFSAFAVLGIYGLAPRLFYQKAGKRVLFDERDMKIAEKAKKMGFYLFGIAFVAISTVVALVKGGGTIPAESLAYATLGGAILMIIARGVIILALYRQGN